MLYLNKDDKKNILKGQMHLTLTSVVFEFYCPSSFINLIFYLTLTSVVFEYVLLREQFSYVFNLTLTSVVFEYHIILIL